VWFKGSLDTLAKELRVLRQRVKLTNLYRYKMEEFDNFKMEHALMKAKFLTYQKRSKRS
jgi:hypothetical protein